MKGSAVPFDDRGLAYGDGLFETVLVRDGKPQLWPEHMARLAEGCRRLDIACPQRSVLDALPAQADKGLSVLKLIVTRGSGGRGYRPPDKNEPRLRWQIRPFSPNSDHWRNGVGVRLCELRLAIQPRLAGIKHLNRLENVLARQEWQDSRIAEGLLCDLEGHLVEATSMNLFWQRHGCLETPGLDCCGVEGTLRAALLRELPIAQVTLPVEAIRNAEALWLGNSVQGIWPVTALFDHAGHCLERWSLYDTHRSLQNRAHELLGYPCLSDMKP